MFQACTLLLSLLFIYDVFFVFVTPYFTKVTLSVSKATSLGVVNGRIDSFWVVSLCKTMDTAKSP